VEAGQKKSRQHRGGSGIRSYYVPASAPDSGRPPTSRTKNSVLGHETMPDTGCRLLSSQPECNGTHATGAPFPAPLNSYASSAIQPRPGPAAPGHLPLSTFMACTSFAVLPGIHRPTTALRRPCLRVSPAPPRCRTPARHREDRVCAVHRKL
jgi:hypothetical protein